MMDHGNHGPTSAAKAIAQLVTKFDFTHRPPYTTRYQQITQTDPDYTVRAMAIRALNNLPRRLGHGRCSSPHWATRMSWSAWKPPKRWPTLPDPAAAAVFDAARRGATAP